MLRTVIVTSMWAVVLILPAYLHAQDRTEQPTYYNYTGGRLYEPTPRLHVLRPTPRPQPVRAARWVRAVDYSPIGISRVAPVLGIRAGGLVAFDSGDTDVSGLYELRLGLRYDDMTFAFELGTAPDGVTVQHGAQLVDADLHTLAATFEYSLLTDSWVHPIAGFGLAALLLKPEQGLAGQAFAVKGRLGLEFTPPVPVGDGANSLGLGIDMTTQRTLVATEAYASDLEWLVTFGGFARYRF